MGKELNNSSINTKKSNKLAARVRENKNGPEKGFSQNRYENEQVVNARKGVNKDAAKAKAKAKKKQAKASKKKNKK